MRISSTDNPLLRRLQRLAQSPRACRDEGRTLVEGVHLIEASLAAQAEIVTLVTRGTATPGIEALLARVDAAARPKRVELAPSLYDSISPVEHGAGVLAEIAIPAIAPASTFEGDSVLLDGVQDPGNVGALLRTAAAAGVRSVLTGAGSAYPWSPKVMRAAMGAHYALAIGDAPPLAALKAHYDGAILAAHIDGDDLFAAEWGDAPTLWLFGAEGQGLSAESLALADRRLRIPITNGVESLNVAAAAAVCLFEQVRRRVSAPDSGRCS